MLATDFIFHEAFHSTTDFLRWAVLKLSPTIEDKRLHGLSQHVLFANLLHRASNPVVIHGRGSMLVLFHPANNVCARLEVSAKRENLLQAFAGNRNHLVAKTIDVAKKVSKEGQVERVIPAW